MHTEKISRSSEMFPFYSRISATFNQPLKLTDTHLHKEIEIVQILNGKMCFTIYDKPLICDTGDIIIINSNIPHSSESIAPNTQQMLFQSDISLVYINTQTDITHPYLYGFLNTSTSIKPYYLFPRSTKLNRELGGYIKNIFNELHSKNDVFETYLKGYLNLLCACLNRNKILVQSHEQSNNNNLNKILPVVDFIDKNYSHPITLGNISKATHLNEYYLCRLFKNVTGQTVFNYINYIRICKAENLLAETSLSVTDIAVSVGFANTARFDEAFKRTTGTTPSKFRRHAYTAKL